MTQSSQLRLYSRILFYFWIYTLLVILWGAWVRISHSGDGCGDHWPLCAGEFIPEFKLQKTWIEYAHRLMTGIYGLFVLFLFFKIRNWTTSLLSQRLNVSLLVLMITEALLGAILVKGQLVTTDDSVMRLIAMLFHQLNSFLLTGVTYLFYLSLKNEPQTLRMLSWKPLALFILLPISGAIAALSVTLFPTISLLEGILQDFATDSHVFVRLRIVHPTLALTLGGGLMIWLFIRNHHRAGLEFLLAIAIGIMTLVTLSPVALKMTHLLVAHLLWARLIYLFVSSPDSNNR